VERRCIEADKSGLQKKPHRAMEDLSDGRFETVQIAVDVKPDEEEKDDD
jgi:hypothetical protein